MRKSIKSGILAILVLFILAINATGQTGAIEGIVKDKFNSEALIGTTVQIDGTTIGTTTDINGQFKLQNLKPGKYNLKVSYVSYTTRIIENVIVENGMTAKIDIELAGNTV